MIEWIGYAASIMVAVSLTMSNIRMLRYFNLVGSSLFSAYGYFLNLPPVFLVNGFIILINIYYLIKMEREKDSFSLIPTQIDDAFFKKFTDFYHDDISSYFPNISLEALSDKWEYLFILRNMNPVGIFAFSEAEQRKVDIHLDYVSPKYRDFKNSYYLFEKLQAQLQGRGFKVYNAVGMHPQHAKYLKKFGFMENPDIPNAFVKPI